MARYRWMRQRMENWAAWKARTEDGGGRFTSVDLTDPTPAATDPYASAPVRPSEEDAWEIEGALRAIALASELRATIECYYLSRYTEAEKLRRLCIAKQTMFDRLDRVDGLLVRHFGERQERQRVERGRVQALQDGMRPR